MPRLGVFIVSLLSVVGAWAVEPAFAEPEKDWEQITDEVKALHKDARKNGDLWVCLMLEAYSQKPEVKARLTPYLGRSTVIGNPLFAFPRGIRNHWDRVTMLASFQIVSISFSVMTVVRCSARSVCRFGLAPVA